jgi:hypothetical protein
MNPNLKQKFIMFALIFNLLLALAAMTMLEGCAIEIDPEPVEVDVTIDVTAGLNCRDQDPLDYLDTQLCFGEEINSSCCQINWSDSCDIYLCDSCIGISDGCYDQES